MKPELLWWIPAGFAAGMVCVPLFNRLPARWLCDYGEEPPPELAGQRVRVCPEGLLLGLSLGAAFFLFAMQYGFSPASFLLSAAALPLVLGSLSDIKYRILPDESLPAILVPAAALWSFGLAGKTNFYGPWWSPFAGALAGGGIWLLVGLLGSAVSRRESLGFGDVKLFAAVGFLCGFPEVFEVFLLTVLLAGAHFLVLMLLRRIRRDQYMPLGPYICAACLLALAFRGQLASLARWYVSLLG